VLNAIENKKNGARVDITPTRFFFPNLVPLVRRHQYSYAAYYFMRSKPRFVTYVLCT